MALTSNMFVGSERQGVRQNTTSANNSPCFSHCIIRDAVLFISCSTTVLISTLFCHCCDNTHWLYVDSHTQWRTLRGMCGSLIEDTQASQLQAGYTHKDLDEEMMPPCGITKVATNNLVVVFLFFVFIELLSTVTPHPLKSAQWKVAHRDPK